MHCTWFNEKKSSFPPYIFLCFFFSLLTRPHISCRPRRHSPAPHNDSWERSGPHPPVRRGSPAGALRPGPAGLQLPTSPGRAPRRPRLPRARTPAAPIVFEGRGKCGRAGGGGPFHSPLSSDPV